MEKYEIERIRATPIEEVAEQLGMNVKGHRCLCPFHDDHNPSMSLHVRTNTYRCWSCGAHGDVISLVMNKLGKNFLEACGWLGGERPSKSPGPSKSPLKGDFLTPRGEGDSICKKSPYEGDLEGLDLEGLFLHPFLDASARTFLFEKRHIDRRVVAFCRLNSYRDWLQIPYYSATTERGYPKLIGIENRYMGTDPKQPRFRFMAGRHPGLYNQPVLSMLRVGEPLYIGEGPSDVWALLSSGRKAIGVPSATLFGADDMKTLAPLALMHTPLHIYPDQDDAGEALYQKLLLYANDLGLSLERHDLPSGCKDFSDYWMSLHA